MVETKKITLEADVQKIVSLLENEVLTENEARNLINQFDKKSLSDYIINNAIMSEEEDFDEDYEQDKEDIIKESKADKEDEDYEAENEYNDEDDEDLDL
ncbi:MAG: hypothetical protein ACOC1K_05420 [Nanoarchaeota archaeon]